ncbi:SDR family NAD(P)-dependent oxidoreductase [Paracoccus benzoatiresistens]|uniref:SDR family NAD(P)-dependent oxidoreductase n=1 Tax=Paracoccus benzoatiresistens TaxID=2997341 RepID=A0ABT4J8U2_9RHOB|nr:SDR family NAD(P)-dependent oxidoreductase [Paracoccus sp. EF6]MCZ0963012.1 SDR family NAD(P)-dependent oxidoreductase [Paracoccus sp. EF6]
MSSDSGKLAGRRIVVTGGASGIGAAVVRMAAREGAKVACLDLNLKEAEALTASLSGQGFAVASNVADPASIRAAMDTAATGMGGIDGLVNSAGVVAIEPAAGMEIAIWQRLIDVNLTGTFLACQAAIPHLVQVGQGASIVNLSSAQALAPVAGAAAYAASKGGVQSLSKALAVELAPAIRVNAVCPGLIDTPMNKGLAKDGDSGPPVPLDRYALGRWGKPEEVAACILFLLANDASYLTGTSIAVDGGRTFH